MVMTQSITRPTDYWQVGQKQYDSLKTVGDAVKDGSLSLATDGNEVVHLSVDVATAQRMLTASRVGAGLTIAGAAMTVATAVLRPLSPAVAVIPLVATVFSGICTYGLHQTARELETKPLEVGRGRLSITVDGGKPALAYQQDTPTKTSPQVLNTFLSHLRPWAHH